MGVCKHFILYIFLLTIRACTHAHPHPTLKQITLDSDEISSEQSYIVRSANDQEKSKEYAPVKYTVYDSSHLEQSPTVNRNLQQDGEELNKMLAKIILDTTSSSNDEHDLQDETNLLRILPHYNHTVLLRTLLNDLQENENDKNISPEADDTEIVTIRSLSAEDSKEFVEKPHLKPPLRILSIPIFPSRKQIQNDDKLDTTSVDAADYLENENYLSRILKDHVQKNTKEVHQSADEEDVMVYKLQAKEEISGVRSSSPNVVVRSKPIKQRKKKSNKHNVADHSPYLPHHHSHKEIHENTKNLYKFVESKNTVNYQPQHDNDLSIDNLDTIPVDAANHVQNKNYLSRILKDEVWENTEEANQSAEDEDAVVYKLQPQEKISEDLPSQPLQSVIVRSLPSLVQQKKRKSNKHHVPDNSQYVPRYHSHKAVHENTKNTHKFAEPEKGVRYQSQHNNDLSVDESNLANKIVYRILTENIQENGKDSNLDIIPIDAADYLENNNYISRILKDHIQENREEEHNSAEEEDSVEYKLQPKEKISEVLSLSPTVVVRARPSGRQQKKRKSNKHHVADDSQYVPRYHSHKTIHDEAHQFAEDEDAVVYKLQPKEMISENLSSHSLKSVVVRSLPLSVQKKKRKSNKHHVADDSQYVPYHHSHKAIHENARNSHKFAESKNAVHYKLQNGNDLSIDEDHHANKVVYRISTENIEENQKDNDLDTIPVDAADDLQNKNYLLRSLKDHIQKNTEEQHQSAEEKDAVVYKLQPQEKISEELSSQSLQSVIVRSLSPPVQQKKRKSNKHHVADDSQYLPHHHSHKTIHENTKNLHKFAESKNAVNYESQHDNDLSIGEDNHANEVVYRILTENIQENQKDNNLDTIPVDAANHVQNKNYLSRILTDHVRENTEEAHQSSEDEDAVVYKLHPQEKISEDLPSQPLQSVVVRSLPPPVLQKKKKANKHHAPNNSQYVPRYHSHKSIHENAKNTHKFAESEKGVSYKSQHDNDLSIDENHHANKVVYHILTENTEENQEGNLDTLPVDAVAYLENKNYLSRFLVDQIQETTEETHPSADEEDDAVYKLQPNEGISRLQTSSPTVGVRSLAQKVQEIEEHSSQVGDDETDVSPEANELSRILSDLNESSVARVLLQGLQKLTKHADNHDSKEDVIDYKLQSRDEVPGNSHHHLQTIKTRSLPIKLHENKGNSNKVVEILDDVDNSQSEDELTSVLPRFSPRKETEEETKDSHDNYLSIEEDRYPQSVTVRFLPAVAQKKKKVVPTRRHHKRIQEKSKNVHNFVESDDTVSYVSENNNDLSIEENRHPQSVIVRYLPQVAQKKKKGAGIRKHRKGIHENTKNVHQFAESDDSVSYVSQHGNDLSIDEDRNPQSVIVRSPPPKIQKNEKHEVIDDSPGEDNSHAMRSLPKMLERDSNIEAKEVRVYHKLREGDLSSIVSHHPSAMVERSVSEVEEEYREESNKLDDGMPYESQDQDDYEIVRSSPEDLSSLEQPENTPNAMKQRSFSTAVQDSKESTTDCDDQHLDDLFRPSEKILLRSLPEGIKENTKNVHKYVEDKGGVVYQSNNKNSFSLNLQRHPQKLYDLPEDSNSETLLRHPSNIHDLDKDPYSETVRKHPQKLHDLPEDSYYKTLPRHPSNVHNLDEDLYSETMQKHPLKLHNLPKDSYSKTLPRHPQKVIYLPKNSYVRPVPIYPPQRVQSLPENFYSKSLPKHSSNVHDLDEDSYSETVQKHPQKLHDLLENSYSETLARHPQKVIYLPKYSHAHPAPIYPQKVHSLSLRTHKKMKGTSKYVQKENEGLLKNFDRNLQDRPEIVAIPYILGKVKNTSRKTDKRTETEDNDNILASGIKYILEKYVDLPSHSKSADVDGNTSVEDIKSTDKTITSEENIDVDENVGSSRKISRERYENEATGKNIATDENIDSGKNREAVENDRNSLQYGNTKKEIFDHNQVPNENSRSSQFTNTKDHLKQLKRFGGLREKSINLHKYIDTGDAVLYQSNNNQAEELYSNRISSKGSKSTKREKAQKSAVKTPVQTRYLNVLPQQFYPGDYIQDNLRQLQYGASYGIAPWNPPALDNILENRVATFRRFAYELNRLVEDVSAFLLSFKAKENVFGVISRKSLFDVSNYDSLKDVYEDLKRLIQDVVQILTNLSTDLQAFSYNIVSQPKYGMESLIQNLISGILGLFGDLPSLLYKSLDLNRIGNNLQLLR